MNRPDFMPTEMTAQDTLDVLRLFEQNGIEVIVDGGWAVDALLGEQSRPHSDLDIAMPHCYVSLARALLEGKGFGDVPRNDTRACNFVLGDGHGHQVDFHTYTFDDKGELIFGLDYPPDSLNGWGTISGQAVRCITPERLVEFHTGYQVDENDYHDVRLLCQRFGIEMPVDYCAYERSKKN